MNYLIAGLGNVGPEYELSRHNAGFLALDRLADQHKAKFRIGRLSYVAEYRYRRNNVYLIKPTTYMNLSGKAVNYWIQELKVPVQNTLVIVDDISLDFGVLRLRARGSSAGHNGLASIEQALGTSVYPRLRVGIGNEFQKGSQVDYVLSRFSDDEAARLGVILDKACEIIQSYITGGIDKTMTVYNKKGAEPLD
jgi:PTH1 family peptidyl-tRNA hydrolase